MNRPWTRLFGALLASAFFAAGMSAYVHIGHDHGHEHGHSDHDHEHDHDHDRDQEHPDSHDCPICIAIHTAAALDLPTPAITPEASRPVIRVRPGAQAEPVLATVCVARIPRAPPV